MGVVADCSLNDEELEGAAGIVGGDTWMMAVGQESPCPMEWRNNYAGHQTDVSTVQRGPCEVVQGCGPCCDSCNDAEGSMMIHLHCYGLATYEDVGVSPRDTRPVVVASCEHDVSSPVASDDAEPPFDVSSIFHSPAMMRNFFAVRHSH